MGTMAGRGGCRRPRVAAGGARAGDDISAEVGLALSVCLCVWPWDLGPPRIDRVLGLVRSLTHALAPCSYTTRTRPRAPPATGAAFTGGSSSGSNGSGSGRDHDASWRRRPSAASSSAPSSSSRCPSGRRPSRSPRPGWPSRRPPPSPRQPAAGALGTRVVLTCPSRMMAEAYPRPSDNPLVPTLPYYPYTPQGDARRG